MKYIKFMLLTVFGIIVLQQCTKQPVELRFSEKNRTPDITVIQTKPGLDTLGVTDANGELVVTKELKRGEELHLLFKKDDYKFEPKTKIETIDTRRVYLINFAAGKTQKSVVLTTRNPIEGIEIFGTKGKRKNRLAVTGRKRSTKIVLAKSKWPDITLSAVADFADIRSQYLNRKIEYDVLPSKIALSAYPNSPVKKSFQIVAAKINEAISESRIVIDQLNEAFPADSNGKINVELADQLLKNHNIELGEELSVTVFAPSYESYKTKIRIAPEAYQQPESPVKITLDKTYTLPFLVTDTSKEPIAGVKLIVNGASFGTTDKNGKVHYTYKIEKLEEKITCEFTRSGYSSEKRAITLRTQNNQQRIRLTAYEYFVECTDQKTGEPLMEAAFDADTDIEVEQVSNGTYRLLFPALNKTYDVSISDQHDRYQPIETAIELKTETLGKSQSFELPPKTSLSFVVTNQNEEPVADATISDEQGDVIGKTDGLGMFVKEITFQEETKTYAIQKAGYKEKSVRHSIQFGLNNIPVTFIQHTLRLNLVNKKTSQPIPGLPVSVNGKEYQSNQDGVVEIHPNKSDEKFSIKHTGAGNLFMAETDQVVYNEDTPDVEFSLTPQMVFKIYARYIEGGGLGRGIEGVNIEVNGQTIGKTDELGLIRYPVPDKNKTYTVHASKEGFEPQVIEDIYPDQITKKVEMPLQGLTQSIVVIDLAGERIANVEVYVGDIKNGETDDYGMETVRFDRLGTKYNIKLIDPLGRYKRKVKTLTFEDNGATQVISMLLKPVTLHVQVYWDQGYPGEGKIEIEPEPETGKSSYKLTNGTVDVRVFKENRYTVKCILNNPPIEDQDVIEIDKSRSEYSLRFTINSEAKFRVLTSDTQPGDVDVYVYAADPNLREDRIGTVRGDGEDVFTSDLGYIDYKLVFQRHGWSGKTERIISLSRPDQLFDLRIDSLYKKCKNLQAEGKYEEAARVGERIDRNSDNFCDAQITLIEIYRKQLQNHTKAVESSKKFIDSGKCEKEWSYYWILVDETSLVSPVNKVLDLISYEEVRQYYKYLVTTGVLTIPMDKKKEVMKFVSLSMLKYSKKLAEMYYKKFRKSMGGNDNPDAEKILQIYEDMRIDYSKELPSNQSAPYLDAVQEYIKEAELN